MSLAFDCQERAKRKLSPPSRGRAGVWNEASSPKDSSNSKGTGRGQKLDIWVKVCQALSSEESKHILEWIWGTKPGVRPPRSLYAESGPFYRAWAVMPMVRPTSEMEVLNLILKVWRHTNM